MKIAAGIIIYNPNKDRLIKCIDSISNQVEKIYLYNNSCDFDIFNLFKNENIKILGLGENIGLSQALNEVFSQAAADGFEWVISLDQDSIVPSKLIYHFNEVYNNYDENENVAILCPRFIDKRREEVNFENYNGDLEIIDVCITSASLTRIKAWKEVGKFDDNLFIDLIDNDFCKNLSINNWKILRLNTLILDQEKGEIVKKSPNKVEFYMKIAKFIKRFNPSLAKNVSKLTYKKNVVPMRVYYTNRNIIYLNKKYKNYGGIGQFGYINYNCHSYLGFHFSFNFPSLIRGKNKIKILSAIVKGIKDGRKMSKTLKIKE